jgi:hypothetical protein
MSNLPYTETGKISLTPTPDCIVVLKRKKSITVSKFDLYFLILFCVLLKCVEK